jgi:NhaP-type Na+/H+ or K+/H+ antiporter/mannitol/fructose-specific phosphotransferase system IIA component (Ntr-type)
VGLQAFTLCFAAAVGVSLIALAGRLRVPSIALLLIGGVLLGPEVANLIDPANLGRGLQMVVSLVVAVILFEGGLTLNIEGARKAPVVISRLLTLGVLITWWGTALSIWGFLSVPIEIAILAGSLVIVTGPTVISPLLRRIGVTERIKHILYWEAVLIDVIGVFIAVLCLEWISPHTGWSPMVRFLYRCGAGVGIGLGSGIVMVLALRRNLIPEETLNIFVLAGALLCFTGAELVLHESGILAVIVAGLSLGMTNSPQLKQLKQFKLELAELGIGTLFILLSATLQLEPFRDYGAGLAIVVAIVLFVLRPLGIMAATYGRSLPLKERVFLSWIAPRGIVAAFMASLFALELATSPEYAEYAQFLQVFTFAVIGSTVILQGLSAPLLAGLLGVREISRRTWLLVGEPAVTCPVALALKEAGVPALVASKHDLGDQIDEESCVVGDAGDLAMLDDPRLSDVGAILLASSDPQLPERVTERWSKTIKGENIHVWGTSAWERLGTPGEVGAMLESGENALTAVTATGEPTQFASHQRPLLAVKEQQASPVDPAQLPAKDSKVVVLRSVIPNLHGLFAGALIAEESGTTLQKVTEALVGIATERDDRLDKAALLRSLRERESAMPTSLGGGLAIPHAYTEGLDAPRVLLGLVPEGTSDKGPNGDAITLVFLVLSPRDDSGSHLRTLASIARLASDKDYVETLMSQKNAEELEARLEERCSAGRDRAEPLPAHLLVAASAQ